MANQDKLFRSYTGTPSLVTVKVPCSTSNLGAGVDTMGLALDLYTTAYFQPSETPCFHPGKGFPADLTEEDNYVIKGAKELYRTLGKPYPSFDITVDTEIPFAHGLGSSSAALLAGIFAANAFLAQPLSTRELIELGTRLEGHPDNVVPCVLGGFTLAMQEGSQVFARSFTAPDLTYVAVSPAYNVSTPAARAVLPETVTRQEAVAQLQRACFLTATLATVSSSGEGGQDLSVLRHFTQDSLFTPARAALMPGSREAVAAALAEGALCAFTSGAGPTMMAWTDRNPESVGLAMQKAYRALDIDSDILYLHPDNQGIRMEVSHQ